MGTCKGRQRFVISLEFGPITLKSCLLDERRSISRMPQQNKATGKREISRIVRAYAAAEVTRAP